MSVRIDRLALLETFLRIVEAGSLSAAASRLGTTQPTVSRRLRALETSLGVPLLQRSTHALQLTAAGERYLARGRELLGDWQRFEVELRDDEEEPQGRLRLVVPHAFGQEHLMPPVLTFLRRYPGVTIEWRLSDGPLRLVEDGIDAVIRVGALKAEALVAQKLFDVRRIVVAAPTVLAERTISRPEQLEALPWLSLTQFYRDRVRLESDRGASRVVRFQPRFATDSLFALRSAVLEGVGVAVLSEWVVAADVAAGRLVHLLPHWSSQSLPVWLAWPRAEFYPARLRRFLEAMRGAFRADGGGRGLTTSAGPAARARPSSGPSASR